MRCRAVDRVMALETRDLRSGDRPAALPETIVVCRRGATERALLELLSAQEIVLMMEQDPDWRLPRTCAGWRQRMDAARRLCRGGQVAIDRVARKREERPALRQCRGAA